MTAPSTGDPLVITDDSTLLDQVQACAAVAGLSTTVVANPATVGTHWSSSEVVLVGLDRAREVAELGLPRRAGVVLLGGDHDQSGLCAWSQPLGATTLMLPGGVSWLSDLLVGGEAGTVRGPRLAIAGGSGGLGTSTLAIGLAQLCRGVRQSVVIDADDNSGGLDLVLGVESVAGRRWGHYADTRGALPSVVNDLPARDQVSVLAAAVDVGPPDPSSMISILRACGREADLTVVDLGRADGRLASTVLSRVPELWLVVGNDIAGVAAARRVRQRLEAGVAVSVVLRQHDFGELSTGHISELLGAEVIGVIPHDRRIARGVEQGLGPIAAAGRRWRAAVQQLGDRVLTRSSESR